MHGTGVPPTKNPADHRGGPGGCCTLRTVTLTSPKAGWTGGLTQSCLLSELGVLLSLGGPTDLF